MIRHQKLKIYLFIVFQITPVYLEAASTCTEWVAKAVSVQGKVETRQAGNSNWENTQQGDVFCQGVTIRADKNSRATLQLSNESLVSVDQNTSLNINILTPKVKASSWLLELIEGSAFFRSRESQRLNIHTPFINAVHEGTEFLVTVASDKTEITVFDGQVAATNQQGKIQIKKGYTGIAKKDQSPIVKALTIRPEDAVQWTLYYPPLIDYQHIKSSSLQSAVNAYEQGNSYQALDDLEILPVAQQNVDYLILKASLLLSVGRADEALTLVKQTASTKQNSTAIALQAVIAVAKNRQDEALNLAQQAVTLNPQSAVAQIALSYAYQANFKIESALQATQEAVRLSPENALAWARLSELQLSTGARSDALESAKKAHALNPQLDRTQTVLGFANLAEVDIDEAKTAFNQAINLNSADPLARLGLGLAKIREGEVEEGTKDLEAAVSLDPDNAIMRSYLGKAYYELKNDGYAGTELTIAKEMDPNDPTPWFYDAIRKQTTNRPVEALHDMQKAIELNDNRGVYRSKLLLDEDLAVRSASLGRIYNDLGFEQSASLEATKSLNIHPSNYSAHRFLSDSFANRPRHEIARASELLQSQLLQPININPIQPRLSFTDLNITRGVGLAENYFNDLSSSFEKNDNRFTATGLYGSNNTLSDEVVFSGVANKTSYSFGQLHYETDGFRENNDLKSDVYNVYLQHEVSKKFNLQAEYRYRDTEHGDLEFKGNKNNFDQSKRRSIEQSSYRLGFKLSPNSQNDFLFSGVYSDRTEGKKKKLIFPGIPDTNLGVSTDNLSYQLETQHLFHTKYFNTIAGGGVYLNEVKRVISQNEIPAPENFDNDQYFGYLYSNIKLLKNLTATMGLSFDSYKDDSGSGIKIEKWNPKFGLRWDFENFLTLRFASFWGLKSPIAVNQTLQPTQVAGFNQFYDDENGTATEQHSLGMDIKFSKKFYVGAEAYKRDSDSPSLTISAGDSKFNSLNRDEELYRFYFNWIPREKWAFSSEFRSERFRKKIDAKSELLVKTTYIPSNVSYFHSSGFFASVEGTYINQSANNSSLEVNNFKNNFYLVDAAIGFKLPKKYGLISLEGKNLFNTDFKFRDRNFQMNEERTSEIVPEQTFFVRVNLKF